MLDESESGVAGFNLRASLIAGQGTIPGLHDTRANPRTLGGPGICVRRPGPPWPGRVTGRSARLMRSPTTARPRAGALFC
jgi:hypothetical protein